MAYLLSNINVKNSKDGSWRLISVAGDKEVKKQLGQLFCIAELPKSIDLKITIIEELINFASELFIKQDTFTSTRSEDLLEHLLEEVNRKFTQKSIENNAGSFSGLSFIIGIIKDQNLVISSYGSLEAWLLHPFAKKAGKPSYRWVNILENSKKGNGDFSGKLFDQVIAGELSDKQSFVVGTKNLWQVFTQDKFKKLVLDNNSNRIKQVITKTVHGLPSETDLALLLGKEEKRVPQTVKEVTPETTPEEDRHRDEKHRAIAQLFSQDKDTQSPRKRTGDTKRMPTFKKESKSLEQHTGTIVNNMEKKISVGKGWYLSLSTKAKILLIASFVLIVGVIQSFSWINARKQEDSTSVLFNERLVIIQGKQDEAEAKLIYNDKISARELVEDALNLVYDLPERYEKEQLQKQELTKDLTSMLQEIDGLETLPILTSVYTFTEATPFSQLHEIIPLRSGFMLFVTDDTSLIALDIEGGRTSSITLTGLTNKLSDTTYDADTETLYVLNNRNELFKILVRNLTIDSTSAPVEQLNFSIADIGNPSVIQFYTNKIYAADPADKQIKKLTIADSSVSNWLNNERNGIGALIDLAIDGNIFLVTQSEIQQFFRGEATGWAITGLTPSPVTIVAFHADVDDQFKYILDNATSRLIVLNEDGSLFKQFTSEQLISPSTFTVNEQGKEIYLLDGKSIFRLPITWLTE